MQSNEGKDKILKVAEDLITNYEYHLISARKIARDANLSVGTLYHHYPNGKLSILYEILRNKFIEYFNFSEIEDSSDPRIIKDYLIHLIESLRQNSRFIKAFEIEILTNERTLVDLKESLKTEESGTEFILKNMILKFYPNIKQPEITSSIISRIFNSIMYYHIIFEDFFGNDEVLVNILYDMLEGLIKNKSD